MEGGKDGRKHGGSGGRILREDFKEKRGLEGVKEIAGKDAERKDNFDEGKNQDRLKDGLLD